jgi:predicted DNA-binding transcriptional regulator AlpA
MNTKAQSDQLLTEDQVSKITALPIRTLQNWRFQRRGLPYIKLGKSVRYKQSVLDEYIKGREVQVEPF